MILGRIETIHRHDGGRKNPGVFVPRLAQAKNSLVLGAEPHFCELSPPSIECKRLVLA